jgi:hypothetical protein
MKTFAQFLSEAPSTPKPPSVSDEALGAIGGNLLGSPLTNTLNVPQSKASSGSMGFNVDPFTANKLNDELVSSGRNPQNYNSIYSATTDLRSDNNNQENQSVQFRMLQAMFDQLPPNSGMNGTLATDMANTLSDKGMTPQNIPNVNTFDPLADLKKYKLFAPVEYNEVMGDEVGESGFEGTGTDAIYGS